MKLKSFKYFFSFLVLFSLAELKSEEKIDIWKKNKSEEKTNEVDKTEPKENLNLNKIITENNSKTQNITIEDATVNSKEDSKVFGLYDPAENDFNLNMWSKTDPDNVKSIIKRINKIKLSSTAEKLFENTLLSFAYPPKGMSENDFLNLKINWMIDNKKTELIEKFLNQNNTFPNKKSSFNIWLIITLLRQI